MADEYVKEVTKGDVSMEEQSSDEEEDSEEETQSEDSESDQQHVVFPPNAFEHGEFLYYMHDEKAYGDSLFCTDYDIMIWMPI